MVVLCSEVAMSDAEKESEARCKAMLNKLISMVKEQTVEMEALAVRLKATVQPLGPPVHALPLPVPAPTATLVTAVDHAAAAAAPHAEAALVPESPTECSTSGPDTNAGDIQVVAESEPEKGVPTVAPALTEHSSAPSPKLFSTIKQDTVTPTRCSTACRSCKTDVAITSHAPSIGADVDHAEAEATPCTDSIRATVILANCSTPRRLYEQGGLKAWFRELPGGMLDSLPTEEVMQRPSEDDCAQLCTKLDDEMPRKWFDYYQGGVPWMPPWPPPQGPETLLELFHKQAGIRSTMRLVKHPNVLQLFEVRASKSKIYFVLEYAKGGVLFNKIAKGGKLSEDAARRYFHQLISPVDYCHSRGVYHRDLKPENRLLDENENLKVSDFGLSALAESKSQDGLLHTTCGTPVYVAPEVPSRKGYDGAKADIWSCGVTLFVLVAGYLPFHDTNLMEMYRKISKADFRCPRYFSAELKELLHKILDSDPSTRISVSRIKRSAWYRRPVGVNAKKNETETTGNTCSGEATTSGSTECSTSEGNQGTLSHPNLNAFDIISCGTPQASLLKVYISGKLTNRHALTLVDENLRDSHYEEQHSKKVPSFEISDNLDVQGNGLVSRSLSIKQEPWSIPQFRISEWDDRERWVWSPLYESRLAYRQELQVGCLEKFELVNHYSPSHLSPLHKQSIEEVCSAQFTVGPGGNVLCVSEDEISSIISRALVISEERRHLLDAIVESEAADTRGGEHTKTMEKSHSFLSEGSSASSSLSCIGSSDSEASFSSDDLSSYDSSLLLSSLHPEISVNGKVALKGKYSVICVHANQFYTLRKKCCPSELAYITSLSRCKKWDAQGGKSKAFFAKTMDDRFIIKQIKKTEFESFIKFAPDYFKHVYHSLDTGSQTCLAKILGIYQVKQTRHGKEVKIDLMVMENLLFGHNVSRTYDLKGSVFSRYVSDSSGRDTVYLDQNFVEDMRVSPIYIGGRTKHLLQRAIWNDTSFLTSINVMDYSLLVGVDGQKHEFVFGIIDYLRQYTWDKQLETWVKASLVVPKNVSPTVVSPREYKKRFRNFMTKYFLTVPDDWSTAIASCQSLMMRSHDIKSRLAHNSLTVLLKPI